MKKTTCRDLRGACDTEITGETPEEMGENSKNHVMKMVQAGDKEHQDAIDDMMQLSQEDQQAWYKGFVGRFDSLSDA